MKRARSLRLAVALAFLLNVGGSPMAWAHWLGTPGSTTSAATLAPSCHESAAPANHAHAPGSMPCCDGGSCNCAAPALVEFVVTMARVPHPPFRAPADTAALPAHPLDDTLRPPIH